MSADNYYVIHRVPGKTTFVMLMGFASDPHEPELIADELLGDDKPVQYWKLEHAVEQAQRAHAEYGYIISDECWDSDEQWLKANPPSPEEKTNAPTA